VIGIHRAEPLVPGPSHLEGDFSVAELKMYKHPRSDQIPTELIEAGGEIFVVCNPQMH
jgi:hypothetical protein